MFKKIAGVVVAIAPLSAMAEVPASLTTAVTEAINDINSIGGTILGVIVAVAVFSWLRRVIK